MKGFREVGCAIGKTSRQPAASTVTSRRGRSNFARLQLCLFFCGVAIGTPLQHSVRRRDQEQIKKISTIYANEPLYREQSWIFEAIKVKWAWNRGVTGENVKVRINDAMWEHNHHTEWIEGDRFIVNNSSNNSNNRNDYSCGDPNNKPVVQQLETNSTNSTYKALLNHGAAVTSILAADGTNEFCGVGIAPRSKLSFCNYQEGSTNPAVLMHNVIDSQTSYDISINAFSYEGCSSEPRRKTTGVYPPAMPRDEKSLSRSDEEEQPKIDKNSLTRLFAQQCPFLDFYLDATNQSNGPCQVCTEEDFDFVGQGIKQDNIFGETTTKLSSSEGTQEGRTEYNGGVSEECASSVRTYCLQNFRKDEALCMEWIEVINDGNTCSFKSNVGKQTHHSLEIGAMEGRNGLGVIYVFASGDSYGNGDNVNYQAFPKSRFVMTVGAIKMTKHTTGGENGSYLKPIHSTYSTGGSSLFVVAPGGDYDSPHQHVGAVGGERSCGDIGYGTAFAAPVVGGVVALMLEAYPNATWRDIRFIIAETSKPVKILDIEGNNDDASFGINAAGIGYSDLYGFGLISARGAVQKAQNWNRKGKHVPPEIGITEQSGEVNLDIYDDSFSTTTSTIMLYDEQFDNGSSSLESVSVYLKLRYFNRGHLRITLQSPSGTISLLSPGGRHEYGQLHCGEWWEFLTLRSWGENPNGTWKISITDTKSGSGDAKCINRPAFSVPIATELGVPMTCEDYESQGFCSDGRIKRDDVRLQDETFNAALFEEEHGECSMKASSACCACGGGIKPDDDDVLYGQLEEWKIVLGGGSPNIGTYAVNFYDEEFWKIDENEGLAKISTSPWVPPTISLSVPPTISPTVTPTISPTEKQKPPTLPPTIKAIVLGDLPDPVEEIGGFQGVLNGITNFFSRIFGGGDSDSDGDGDGEDNSSTGTRVVVWIITFGFSLLLILRGSSLCDFHVNFSRDSPNRNRS